MELLRDVDLSTLNTFGVPARASWLARFRSEEELRMLLDTEPGRTLPLLVLGGGSNVLFTRDWPGLVLINEVPGIEVVREDERHAWVRAGAGVQWHRLVTHSVEHDLGGLENLSLIPGKVGAAPMQNIGAYGVEMKDTFDSLEAMRIEDRTLVSFDHAACAFGYRESYFKREGRGRFIILHVTFRLTKPPHALNTSYGTIKLELDRGGIEAPTIRDVSQAVIAIRRSKLPDPAIVGNAGSFFKNPVVAEELANRIQKEYPDAPLYAAGPGLVKLAAGWLIEQCGWKGFRADGHGVHDRQALVLVNHGGATGAQIHTLSEAIVRSVKERFGVDLEREVNIL